MSEPSEPELTTVVFRRWYKQEDGTGVIALFPDVDEGRGMCSSYEHMGQHGAASYTGVVSRTRPATATEYADLKRELDALKAKFPEAGVSEGTSYIPAEVPTTPPDWFDPDNAGEAWNPEDY